MIPLRAVFVISVLISGLIFTPSYSFAQSNQDDNLLSSLFELFRQLFSFEDEKPEPVTEFGDAVIVQTSGTSSTDTNENNIVPISNAGPDQTVLEFVEVTLDGSSSTDVDGTIVSYQWTQVSDPPVELSSTSVANPTFDAPEVESEDIVLRFSLQITDDSGDTATDEVDITVENVNSPPIADAGPNQTVLEFAKVTLDGSSSTDSDGTIVSYHWNQFFGTPVTLSSLSDVNPTFDAPDVDPPSNVLKFRLTVTDNVGDSSSDEVEITVNESDDGSGDDGPGDDGSGDDGSGDDGPDHVDRDDNENKVTVCHVPPGNPANSHTIRIGESAVVAHIAHGDRLGDCGGDNENKKDNSGKGNSGVDNSGKGNQNDKDENEKSNSGKGNNHENDNENKKGNSGVDNSGKGNQNDKDENKKSNSGKGNSNDKKDDNENKSNSKLKNNNDDEAKDEDKNDDEDD